MEIIKIDHRKVVIFIKGVDDFGRQGFNHNSISFQHHYPKVSTGDILVYYYPKGDSRSRNGSPNLGAYVVDRITESYYKDGFSYESGVAVRPPDYNRHPTMIDWLIDVKLYSKVENKLYGLISKYNPEVLL